MKQDTIGIVNILASKLATMRCSTGRKRGSLSKLASFR